MGRHFPAPFTNPSPMGWAGMGFSSSLLPLNVDTLLVWAWAGGLGRQAKPAGGVLLLLGAEAAASASSSCLQASRQTD